MGNKTMRPIIEFLRSLVTDCISVEGIALTSVRLPAHLFSLYLRNQLTIDLQLLHATRS